MLIWILLNQMHDLLMNYKKTLQFMQFKDKIQTLKRGAINEIIFME